MAAPSLTYTLTNGTTADASQVMQNFNDIINGITDGTKDLSLSALTLAGTLTANGSVTLGNASADDVTVTGSLASSIPIKTTASYDIGSSTLGLRKAYFGANSQTVAIAGSSSMSATWTLTLPTTAGTANYILITDGSGNSSWSNWTNSAWYATASGAGTVSTASQSFAGVKTFNDGIVVASGGSTLTSFVETDISINFDTGAFSGGSSQTITAKLTKIGKVCTLYMPQILATTNGTSSSMTTTGTPLASYVGSQRKRFPIVTAKNGTLHQGVMRVETTGAVHVYYDTNEAAAGWTSGDTNSGIIYTTITWTTD